MQVKFMLLQIVPNMKFSSKNFHLNYRLNKENSEIFAEIDQNGDLCKKSDILKH